MSDHMAVRWLKQMSGEARDNQRHWTEVHRGGGKSKDEAWANAKFFQGRAQAFEDALREIYGVDRR